MSLELIEKIRVVPVVVINKIEEARGILQDMCDGGLPIAEITYRTAAAKDAIALAVKEFPQMCVGAGTVINKEQAEEAISLGVQFIVGPGFDNDVADVCNAHNVPYFPGCVTPTEIIYAINKGCKVIKFFPASVYGGLKAMKALSGPFPQIKFIPTGGVDETNLAEYLNSPIIKACGGSWMLKGDIKAKCKQVIDIVEAL